MGARLLNVYLNVLRGSLRGIINLILLEIVLISHKLKV